MQHNQLDHSHHRAAREAAKNYSPLCYLAHDIAVPMNIGSLFRIADALGVEKLYLSGCSPVPPNRKIRKTSRATEQYVPFCHAKNPLELVNRLKLQGYTMISLEITSSSRDIRQLTVSRHQKICLILGAEQGGVCQDLLDVSDQVAHIPMLGQNSSMNVATACAIATFEILRNRLPYRENPQKAPLDHHAGTLYYGN